METKQVIITASVGVAGAAIGFGAGYLVFKKKYEKIAEAEIESVREAYGKNAKIATEKPDLQEVKQNLFAKPEVLTAAEAILHNEGYSTGSTETDAEAFERIHGRAPTTFELIQIGSGADIESFKRPTYAHDDDAIEEGNVFDNLVTVDPETLGAEEIEVPPRSPDRPYIIPASEFYLNETDYDQITLTYWADDDVLADDDNKIIHNVEEVTGETNLHRFGTLSEDPDIVYVRNEKTKADYEVTKDERSYTEVIQGVKPDEDTTSRPQRMRSNDD